jgi:DNA polymerase-3 subunit epsilon
MREIVLDTETTGLDPSRGDRIVEIGCLELVNRLPTGKTYHVYINPERDMPREAEAVHGLSAQFLADKPLFAEIADEFVTFVKGAALIIHNAAFDMKFLHAELALLGRDDLREAKIIDTLTMARKKFPGAPASLDALCRRFGVDNSGRDLHGALIDSELLAGVYLELSGGRQPGLVFQADGSKPAMSDGGTAEVDRSTLEAPRRTARQRRADALPSRLSEEERAAHRTFLQALPQRALWLQDDGADDER